MKSVESPGLGRELRRLRLRRNFTQEDLAAATDLTQRTISMIENGRQRPNRKTLLRLAEALDASPEDLDPELVASKPRPTEKMPDEAAKPLLPLVEVLARKYARWSGERDELRSAGQDALFEAWGKYGPEQRRVPFEKFAAKRIKWRIRDKAAQLARDKATAGYGLGSLPRFAREFLDAGGSDQEDTE